ncbi:aminotransferase class V-fold PLP-dependent enzyme [Marinoscillum furvescens]|nr:aminotransferase class V-fold PLP-dependent enzyme [Marinoscillum furvescens]
MANFYPGPSRVYSHITEYIYEAYMDGVMSANHRSELFMDLMVKTKSTLSEKLCIPEGYELVFTSSATECWEIIAQSLTQKGSQHFYNGSFGEKWASYSSALVPTTNVHFGINEVLPTGDVSEDVDVLCVTHNETSNATIVRQESLQMLREENLGKLIAVDATSSLGGVKLDFTLADVWYASVQKCLGLPAGMGVMILSPKAQEVAYNIGEGNRYNSLVRILDNAKKHQTVYTPNVLSIYLLMRTQKASKGIDYIAEKLSRRLVQYEELISSKAGVSHLVENEAVRSSTVLALKVDDPEVLKSQAEEYGIILGNGYGPWKPSTIRIANFPAIKSREVEKLIGFLDKHL